MYNDFQTFVLESDTFFNLKKESKLLFVYLQAYTDENGAMDSLNKAMLLTGATNENVSELESVTYIV